MTNEAVTKTVDPEVAAKDINGDGHISKDEMALDMEFKRKRLEDEDAMRDAQRKMTWFALAGLLLYPIAIVIATVAGLNTASEILGDMAPTYFVAVAGLVAAFFGADAIKNKKSKKKDMDF